MKLEPRNLKFGNTKEKDGLENTQKKIFYKIICDKTII